MARRARLLSAVCDGMRQHQEGDAHTNGERLPGQRRGCSAKVPTSDPTAAHSPAAKSPAAKSPAAKSPSCEHGVSQGEAQKGSSTRGTNDTSKGPQRQSGAQSLGIPRARRRSEGTSTPAPTEAATTQVMPDNFSAEGGHFAGESISPPQIKRKRPAPRSPSDEQEVTAEATSHLSALRRGSGSCAGIDQDPEKVVGAFNVFEYLGRRLKPKVQQCRPNSLSSTFFTDEPSAEPFWDLLGGVADPVVVAATATPARSMQGGSGDKAAVAGGQPPWCKACRGVSDKFTPGDLPSESDGEDSGSSAESSRSSSSSSDSSSSSWKGAPGVLPGRKDSVAIRRRVGELRKTLEEMRQAPAPEEEETALMAQAAVLLMQ